MDSSKSNSLDVVESLLENSQLASKDLASALTVLNTETKNSDLLTDIHRLMAIVTGVFGGCALIFFVAANWQAMGQYAKFAVVQSPFILSVIAYLVFERGVIKQAALILAFFSIGGAFALFGQTYQTGADPWQLFFNWALLGMPLVFISRTQGLFALWAIVANAALTAYGDIWLSFDQLLLGLIALNVVFLISWQVKVNLSNWVRSDWGSAFITVFLCGLWATCYIFGLWENQGLSLVNWLISIAGFAITAFYFRFKQLNRLILIMIGLCLIICANATMLRITGEYFFEGILMLCFALTIGLGVWLANYVSSLSGNVKEEGQENG